MKNKLENDFTQLLILNTFLENHSNEELQNLSNTKVSELHNLNDFNSYQEIIKSKEIWHRLFEQKDYDVDILSLVDNKKRNLFRFLSSWFLLCLITMLVIPLILSNYWLYLFLLLLPISALASGPIKTPIKPLFWLIIIGIGVYGIAMENYDLLIMLVPLLILKYSVTKARKVFQKSIIKAAKSHEIFFKFLYITGNISVYDSEKDELYNV